MKIGGFDFPKRDLALDALWVFAGFYSLFTGAWTMAIIAIAFILMHVSLVIQDNIIKQQSEVIQVLLGVIKEGGEVILTEEKK